MTVDEHFKRQVRGAAERTGRSYAATRALLNRSAAPPFKKSLVGAAAAGILVLFTGCHGSTAARAQATNENPEEITKSIRALLPHAERLDERQMRVLRAAAVKCELGVIGAHSVLDPDFDLACLKDAAPNQMEVIFRKARHVHETPPDPRDQALQKDL